MNNQNPRSTVIEIFYPGGFAEDYEFTARALGIKHYGVWDDQTFTAPDSPQIAYPEGFQGNEIPISESWWRPPAKRTSGPWPLRCLLTDGKAVADLIVQRLLVDRPDRIDTAGEDLELDERAEDMVDAMLER